MMSRVGEWRTSKRAELHGWRLIFNVQSGRWGGSTANIQKTGNPNNVVYGVIYQIAIQKLNVLTTYERVQPQEVTVVFQGGEVTANTYVFHGIGNSRRPPEAYIRVMIDGLRQHGYSEEIITSIERTIPER